MPRLAAPAREKADREEGNDDDDDPQDRAEDAPPFDDTLSFRPFDLTQEPYKRRTALVVGVALTVLFLWWAHAF
jgi:hypothetical protein